MVLALAQDVSSASTPTPFCMLLPALLMAQMVKVRFAMNEASDPAQNQRTDFCHRARPATCVRNMVALETLAISSKDRKDKLLCSS